jgi:hypothetical protein
MHFVRLTSLTEIMSQKKKLIKAIKEDNSYEYELAEDLILHTDWEGDNRFFPAVIDLERQYEENEIENILHGELNDVFTFQFLEYSDSDNYDLYYTVVLRFTNDELKESEAWV